MRWGAHRFRRIFRSRKTDLGVERSRNPDLGRFSLFEKLLKSLLRPADYPSNSLVQAGWRLLCWRGPGYAGQAMPGRFAETVGLDDSFEKFFPWEESRPWRGLCRARRASGAVGRARTKLGEPGVGRATKRPLGEPVLIGRGASHQTRLGEPLRGWASHCSKVPTRRSNSPSTVACMPLAQPARTEQPAEHPLSPASLLYAICAIWLLQGKPLNIHSPPAPCYMCYMCYMAI